MDAAMTPLMHVLVTLAVLGVVLNTLLIGWIWHHQDNKHARVDTIDRRVTVIEERISSIGEIKAGMLMLRESMSALNERSKSTLEMVHSIQDYLREGRNEK